MGSYSVYKVLRPSVRNGTRLKIHVEWTTSRAEAVRIADEIRRGTSAEVEAVEVVDHCSGEQVIYRTSGEELITL